MPFLIDAEYGWLMLGSTGVDREIQDEFRVKITAIDEGGLNQSQSVHVRIRDSNDCAPVFDRDEYVAVVDGDVLTTPLFKLNVTVG